jgi:dTDP-4-dehydrorhamnose 3,5-epimerase-like enzyme
MKVKKEKSLENERGSLVEFITRKYNIKQVNILFSFANTVRGNHYHKITEEFFYVIDGKVKVALRNIKTGKTENFIVSSKESFTVTPYHYHTLEFLKDTQILSFYSKEFDINDTDIFTI